MTTVHFDRGDGFTRCSERIDERTKFGGGCYYCQLALDKELRSRVPCKCGAKDAFWKGDSRRVYACHHCHMLDVAADKEEHP